MASYDRGFTSSAAKLSVTSSYAGVAVTGSTALDASAQPLPSACYLAWLHGEIDTIASSAAEITWYIALDSAGDRPITSEATVTIVAGATDATDGGVSTTIGLDYLAPAGAAGTLYVFAKCDTGTCSLTPRLHWRRS
jgi:hypothetical protein